MFTAKHAFAQSTTMLEREITIRFENKSLAKAIEIISNTEKIYFSYNSNLLASNKIVSINANLQTVKKILEEMFKGTNIEFIEYADQIILRAKKPSEKFIIRGTIFDDVSSAPLSYATLELLTNKTGTISDFTGKFEFEIF